jgi:hypothetical protein
MKIYNKLKNRSLEEIDGYIEMLDKKGDREGLKQALKAKADAGKRQSDYQQAKKLESEARQDFEKHKPRDNSEGFNFKAIEEEVENIRKSGKKGTFYTDKDGNELKLERKPQSEDDLKDKVLKEYDEARFPDIAKSKTDPNIKRAELSEESKVKSLSDYTSGKVNDEKDPETDEEIKEYLKKSRKRVGN